MTSEQVSAGWTLMRFDEMAEQVSERVYDPVTAGISIYVGLEHLSADDLRIRSDKPATEVTYGTHGKLRLRPGQIVFGRRSANLRKLGVSHIDAVCSEHAMILNERDALVPGFLALFMQSDVFMNRAVEISEGSLSTTIKWATMANQTFMIPTIEKQLQIVEVMRGFDLAIDRARQTYESINKLEKSLLKTVSVLTKDWNHVALSTLAESRRGRTRSPRRLVGVRPRNYLRALNIRDGYINYKDVLQMDFTEDEQKKDELIENDILLVEGGESRDVGMCSLFSVQNEPYCFQDHVIRVRIKDVNKVMPKYVFHIFRQLKRDGVFALMSRGTKIKNISHLSVAALAIPIAPIIEQSEVVSRLGAVLDSLDQARQHIDSLRVTRSAILNTSTSPSEKLRNETNKNEVTA